VIPAAGPITAETHSPPYAVNTPTGFRTTYAMRRTFNGLTTAAQKITPYPVSVWRAGCDEAGEELDQLLADPRHRARNERDRPRARPMSPEALHLQEFRVVISRNHRGQFPFARRMTPNKSARRRGETLTRKACDRSHGGALERNLAMQTSVTAGNADGVRFDVQLHVEGGLLRQVEVTCEDQAGFVAPIDVAALRKSGRWTHAGGDRLRVDVR
jgi:hypothetical protein